MANAWGPPKVVEIIRKDGESLGISIVGKLTREIQVVNLFLVVRIDGVDLIYLYFIALTPIYF